MPASYGPLDRVSGAPTLLPMPGDSTAPLPTEAHAEIEGVVVGAVADLAVVAQVELRRRGNGGGGREADGGGIALRRRAIDGEGVGRCASEGRRDRPAGVGVFVHPAQAQVEAERALAAQSDGARQIGAQGGAQRGGGLRRHVEAERLRARFAETVLRPARRLEAAER